MIQAAPIDISVITPSFNQGDFIERTILSVISQKIGSQIEMLVIDGGSNDQTLEILRKFDSRIRWVSERDKGQSDAINKGIRMATGDIIGWLNSDDTYCPETLEKVVDYFSLHPECMWLYGKCRIIDEEDREIRKKITWYKNLFTGRFSFEKLLIENPISQPAVFFRRKVFDEVGLLDPSVHFAMDYDLWLRLSKKYSPGYIPEYLSNFRVQISSKSVNNFRRQFRQEYEVHKRHDSRKLYLFLHWLNIRKIIVAYSLMQVFRGKGT
jgi:glycosyltransferase involved in cell wall biosynthesis